MEVSEILEYYNTPDILIEDIITTDEKQKRLLSMLRTTGIKTTGELRQMTNEEIQGLQVIEKTGRERSFGAVRLVKLCELITEWYKLDFPRKPRLNVSEPNTVLESLQEVVFYTYKNIQMIAQRGNYQSYGAIGRQFGKSRQSVQDKEKYVVRKFVEWYNDNRLSEKIGNYNDFLLYCKENFPKDQWETLTAVKRVVTVANGSAK